MSALTEAEYDSLTECECGHFANEHSSEGCLATDFSEDWRPISDDDKCSCSHSPTAINRHAIEAIVAAREAAAREAVLAEVEALAREFIPPYNCELRYDGTEDPSIAAWVEDRSEVVDRLRALVARLRADS